MKNKLQQFKKNCPNCGNEQTYSRHGSLKYAIQHDKLCRSCINSGELNPFYNKKHTEEHKQHMRNIRPYYPKYTPTEETRKKLSESLRGKMVGELNPMYGNCGKLNPFFGKYHTTETRIQMSRSGKLRKIREFEERNGFQLVPNYNPISIPILEQKAKELGITDLQHAENGGEFRINEIGYYVDGYSKEKNIVIEYYEKFHKNNTEKDLQRQIEITNLLKCEFIIINE